MNKIIRIENPGKLLLSEIAKQGMKQKELAVRTGVSDKHISTIINGAKSISVSFGRKLDIALGDAIGTWTKHQTDYDNYMALLEEENGITSDEADILKKLKDIVEYFVSTGIMHNNCGDAEKILQLRKILCVNNLTVIPQITYNAAYRAQIKRDISIDQYVLFAWQRMCELQTANIQINAPFDPRKLSDSIPAIKSQMFNHDPNTMILNLKDIFAGCGIAFDVVRHFRRAPVQGFIKQSSNDKVILCVTIRGKAADRFWFSLFHEIGHLLNGDLCTRFVDFDSVKTELEENADAYARDTLLDPTQYEVFINAGNYPSLEDIKQFAKAAGVPHWVVIGRLHKDELLDWGYLAHETPSFEWAA